MVRTHLLVGLAPGSQQVSIPSSRGNDSDILNGNEECEQFTSQSPQVGAMIRTYPNGHFQNRIDYVSIPSSRGNDSDLYNRFLCRGEWLCLNPLKSGQ